MIGVTIIFVIKQDISLKEHSSFRIGGAAKYFLGVSNVRSLKEGLEEWQELSVTLPEQERKAFILGGGTNILAADAGFPGLIIHPEIKEIEKTGERVFRVGAGVAMSSLIQFCLDNSLSGLEWAGGLPGTVGGAARGNAGAFGGETKDSIVAVSSLEISSLEEKRRVKEDCKFVYRGSIFKDGDGKDEVVTFVEFKLVPGKVDEIKKQTEDHIAYRKTRHPLHLPNAGSIFKNIPTGQVPEEVLKEFEGHIKNDPFPVLPAAKLIASSGLQGKRIGDAMVSTDHPNFIVNVGNSSAQNVKDLITFVQENIQEKYGIVLEPEIMFVS